MNGLRFQDMYKFFRKLRSHIANGLKGENELGTVNKKIEGAIIKQQQNDSIYQFLPSYLWIYFSAQVEQQNCSTWQRFIYPVKKEHLLKVRITEFV